jgi:hypothetical protein
VIKIKIKGPVIKIKKKEAAPSQTLPACSSHAGVAERRDAILDSLEGGLWRMGGGEEAHWQGFGRIWAKASEREVEQKKQKKQF